MSRNWTKEYNALRNFFGFKDYIKPVCPICHELLKDVDLTRDKQCKNGHRFGPDMQRVEIINDGDHHGAI